MSTDHSTDPIPAFFYGRVSTADQTSVPEQRDWARDLAPSEGCNLIGEFTDEGIPGAEIKYRQGLQDMLKAADNLFDLGNGPRVLFVWNLDRLSRADSLRTAGVLGQLLEAGVTRVRTSEGEVDLTNPQDLLMLNIGQDYQRAGVCRDRARDVTRSLATRARQGFWTGGPVPLGYRQEAGKLVLGPEAEVALVRRIFDEYLAGASTAVLARRLTHEGIKPPRAKAFCPETVGKILKQRLYVGDHVWNRRHKGRYARLRAGEVRPCPNQQERENARRRRRLKALPEERNAPEDLIISENVFPPIIDRTTFDAVQSELRKRRNHTSPAKHNGPWVLTGLLICGHCGAAIHGRPEGPRTSEGKYKYHRLYCSARKASDGATCPDSGNCAHDAVLKEVLRLLQVHLGEPSALKALRLQVAEMAERFAANLQAQRDRLQARRAELQAEVEVAGRTWALAPDDVKEDALRALRGLKADLQQTEDQLRDLEPDARTLGAADPARVNRLLDLIRRLPELHDKGSPSLLRAALRDLIEKVALTFTPLPEGPRRGKGCHKIRTGPPKVAVTLSPAFRDLLTTGCRGQEVPLILEGALS
jgi:site-specific DNA recombinase